MGKGLFITATGTDVGKTYVTGLMIKKLREAGYLAGYYKAALSGAELIAGRQVPGDAEVVKALGGFSDKNEEMVSYVYQRAVSPHLAARIEGNPVELHVVKRDYQRQKEKYDLVAVEGSGGIVCPLRMDEGNELFLEDVIKGLGLSTLVVADGGLGTINAVVLTIAYMRQQAIPVKGIILNRYQKGDLLHEDNRRMIEACTKVPVIGTVALEGKEIELEAEKLASLFQ